MVARMVDNSVERKVGKMVVQTAGWSDVMMVALMVGTMVAQWEDLRAEQTVGRKALRKVDQMVAKSVEPLVEQSAE